MDEQLKTTVEPPEPSYKDRVITVGTHELRPYRLLWKKKRELKQLFTSEIARTERLRERTMGDEKSVLDDVEAYAAGFSTMVGLSDTMHELLLKLAYNLKDAELETMDPQDVHVAVAAFLEVNEDPETLAAAKKARRLLQGARE